ncbi:GntR family transcriptional regulator [Paenibacillus sp. MBLB4367]|uniref:GntR family transcriptional regulator n=1 Tax=Paenibacillus sp. MBLB4367 TaxID=3384767 RepID=UPI003907F82A
MGKFTFMQQTNISLREKVVIDIRTAILSGKLQPGERLKEADIADQMGISKGPVREAFRQLEREGLLITQPYKDTVVADTDGEEVRDLVIPIRFHLEWFVIEKYSSAMDEVFFEKLQQIVREMSQHAEEGRMDRLVELDLQFHETIISVATERTLQLTWRSIFNQMKLHFMKNLRYFNKDEIVADHQKLLERLRTKEPALIRDELIRHMDGNEHFLYSSRKE